MGWVIVAASLGIANAILMESSLSFLGLGVQIPRASWGSIFAECAGTYSGCTETCGISGSSDSVYSTEFQFTW